MKTSEKISLFLFVLFAIILATYTIFVNSEIVHALWCYIILVVLYIANIRLRLEKRRMQLEHNDAIRTMYDHILQYANNLDTHIVSLEQNVQSLTDDKSLDDEMRKIGVGFLKGKIDLIQDLKKYIVDINNIGYSNAKWTIDD